MNITCINCRKNFTLDERDQEFYKKVNVPLPDHCPDCRQQQRCAWRNELNLYQRACGLCNQTMISLYHPDSPYTVYCKDCWWSDRWDPQAFGRAYNPKQNFFAQFHELNLRVPQLGFISTHCENSDYCTYSVSYKDSYMCISGVVGERMYYDFFVNASSDSVDCGWSWKLERCYECIDSRNLYQASFCQDCEDSSFIQFCFDCINCSKCLGCVNLRNKEYYYFNEPISPAEYEQKVREIFSSAAALQDFKRTFADFKQKFPKPHARHRQSESSTGNYIYNSVWARDCFDVTNIEQGRYIWNTPQGAKDVYDISYSPQAELSYNSISIVNGKYVLCSATSWDLKFSAYCWLSFYSQYLFGCVGVRHGQYQILNTSYSEADYTKIIQQIETQMRSTNDYGNFFPLRYSPFAYNESSAQQWFPLTQSMIKPAGLRWQVESTNIPAGSPDTITCHLCTKPFRLIPQEKVFYQTNALPHPTVCFRCRLQARIQQRNPHQLWQRSCACTRPDHNHTARCQTTFATTYSLDQPELIYCAACYAATLN